MCRQTLQMDTLISYDEVVTLVANPPNLVLLICMFYVFISNKHSSTLLAPNLAYWDGLDLLCPNPCISY